MRKKRIAGGIISAGTLAFLLGMTDTPSILHSEENTNQTEEVIAVEKEGIQPSLEEKEAKELTHEQVISLTDRFMEELVQNTDESYKVVNYQTKKAFIEDFTQLTSQEVAEEYINTYYVQEEDGLYVIPTSTPPWFVKEQAYEMERVAEDTFIITQHNRSELHGEYTLELKLTYQDKWKITDTVHK